MIKTTIRRHYEIGDIRTVRKFLFFPETMCEKVKGGYDRQTTKWLQFAWCQEELMQASDMGSRCYRTWFFRRFA